MRCLLVFALSLTACSQPELYQAEGDGIPAPLTTAQADPNRGAILFDQRGGAHCILCHKHGQINAEFQGNLGPDLTRLGDRLSAAQIRLRVADYDAVKPGTTMPSYYRTRNLYEVDAKYSGQTVLTALEIEDIIAFLTDEDDNAPEN